MKRSNLRQRFKRTVATLLSWAMVATSIYVPAPVSAAEPDEDSDAIFEDVNEEDGGIAVEEADAVGSEIEEEDISAEADVTGVDPALTIYYHYDHNQLEDGQYIVAAPWSGSFSMVSENTVDTTINTNWNTTCYKFSQAYADWWKLELATRPTVGVGFELHLLSSANEDAGKLAQYSNSDWKELYDEITSENNSVVTIDNGDYYLNDVATAYTQQVTMYIYDETAGMVPGLYLWSGRSTFPLKYVDRETKTVSELTAKYTGSDNLYVLSKASDAGDNWYKITFIADLSKEGVAFTYERDNGTGIEWNSPGIEFNYDGYNTDASVMVTEGKVYYKDGIFSDTPGETVSGNTLKELRELTASANALVENKYTAASWVGFNDALVAANSLLGQNKYSSITDDEEAAATIDEDITSKYEALKAAMDALVLKPKTVTVYYYEAENDLTQLFVRRWGALASYVDDNLAISAVDGHEGWYKFELSLKSGIEAITESGFTICNNDSSWSNQVGEIKNDLYNKLIVNSADGNTFYVKNNLTYKSIEEAESVSLYMLGELVVSCNYASYDYTAESFTAYNEALISANKVLDDNDYESKDEDARKTTMGAAITAAYDLLVAKINALVEVFKPDKAVRVYYYSKDDLSGMNVYRWDAVKPYINEGSSLEVYDEYDNWYRFVLQIKNEVGTVTPEGDVWPGISIGTADNDAGTYVKYGRGFNYDIYKAIIVDSQDMDYQSYYIKDGEVFDSYEAATAGDVPVSGNSLKDLRDLVELAELYKEADYTAASWEKLSAALVSANSVLDKAEYKALDDTEAADLKGEDIDEVYKTLATAIDELVHKPKTITVYYYSDETDLSELVVKRWTALDGYVKDNLPINAVGTAHPNWYLFTLNLTFGIEDAGESGFSICGTNWTPEPYKIQGELYNTVVAQSVNGDIFYVKNNKTYSSFDEAEKVTIYMLGELTASCNYVEADYTQESFADYSAALVSANNVLTKYGYAGMDEDEKKTTMGDDISAAYDLLIKKIAALTELFKTEKTVTVNYYSEEDLEGLTIVRWDDVKDLIREGITVEAVGEAHPEWYTFVLEMKNDVESVTKESGMWPGILIGNNWDDYKVALTTKENYDIYKALVIDSENGATLCVKDGEIFDSIEAAEAKDAPVSGNSLKDLRALTVSANALTETDYTEESWAKVKTALVSVNAVLAKDEYKDKTDTEAEEIRGDDIDDAYNLLNKAMNSLKKAEPPFVPDRTVTVYYYSSKDISGLYVMPFKDIAECFKNEEPLKAAGDEHPNWYSFTLELKDEIKGITDEGDAWPGIQICDSSWNNTVATFKKGSGYEIYKAIVIDSKDGDILYLKNGEFYESFEAAEVTTLLMLRVLVDQAVSVNEALYTEESYALLKEALISANAVLSKAEYSSLSATEAGETTGDDIILAYAGLLSAMDSLKTITQALTIYFYCPKADIPEDGFVGATLWHEGDLTAADSYELAALLWGNPGYALKKVSSNWWKLELKAHPSATEDVGFQLDAFDSSNESKKTFGEYSALWGGKEIFAYFTDNENDVVAVKGSDVFVNDEAIALIEQDMAGRSLYELRALVVSANSLNESDYTAKTWAELGKALVSANAVLEKDEYKNVTDEAAGSIKDDEITDAYDLLANAMDALVPDKTAETIFYRYDHSQLEEGQYLAVNPWSAGNLTPLDAQTVNVDFGDWTGECYKLEQFYANWWSLDLATLPAGGFSLYLVDASNVSVAKLNEYDGEWNNTETFAAMTAEDTMAIAIDGDDYYLNDVAVAYIQQVTMYIYDDNAGTVPGLYLWANGGEWDDATYPLTIVDKETKTVKELTADVSSEGNNLYALTDASGQVGANWYGITFIADLLKTGRAFTYDRYDGSAIVWEPGTEFSYDGSKGVDASVMVTEGKVFFKDGAFSDEVATTLTKLRELVKEAEGLSAESYNAESFAEMKTALVSANQVLDNYSTVSDEDAKVTTGDDIEAAYAGLKKAIDSLVKLFSADKTVKVFYYSETDWSGLLVKTFDAIREFMRDDAPVTKVTDHENWYSFTLEMENEIEAITDEVAWPGFAITNSDWSGTVMEIGKGATYDIYKAIVITSKDGDEIYVKDGKIFTSFDGAERITLAMLLELIVEADSYAKADFSADSFAAMSKVLAEAKKYAADTQAEPDKEDPAATAAMYNKLLDAMNALKYSTIAGINVKKVALDDDFITGADLSSFVSVRQSGVVFKADTNGDGVAEALSDQQFFNYLKAGGTNWVRIRIWNDPYDSSGNGYGGGNNDVNKAVTLAKLAQKAGMKILIDFHYSDFWADPAKYKAPKAWADMTNQQKADALYDFTYESLETLHDAGINDIYMVQVGNESNHGIAGETDNNATILYGYGCEAVHDAAEKLYGHHIDAAVHFTDVQRSGATVIGSMERQVVKRKYKSHADGKEQYVPYDAVGVSYYPMYNHGDIANLKAVLKELRNGYGPGGTPTRVFVAETSWAWTWLDGDGYHNSGPSISGGQDVTSYSISVQGQADEVRAVVDAVNSVNEGDELSAFGVFYWESAWLSPYQACYDDYSYDEGNYKKNVEAWEKYGSGWASKYSVEYDPTDAGLYYGGVGVDNMGWFNFDGTALDTARIFKLIRTGASTDKKKVVAVRGNQKIILNVGTDEEIDDILPDTVSVYYNDGSEGSTAVVWNRDEKKKIDLDEAGIYEITGKAKAEGVYYAVKLTVEVVANNSIGALKNNDFELIEDNTGNNVKFYNWDVYGVNEDGTYVTYMSQTDGTDNTKYFNWGTNNITINNENAKGDTQNGHALNFWHGEAPMDIRIYQKIGTAKAGTEFIPGNYTFGGYLEGGSAGKYDKQYAAAYVYDSEAAFNKDLEATKKDPVHHPLGTDAKRSKASTQFAGWLSWKEVRVEDVQVNAGQYLVVGFEMNGSIAGAWGSVDDTYLYGTYNVNITENTGKGTGQLTASRYVAGTGEKVKLTSKSGRASTLNTITVTGAGVNEDYFRKQFANGKTAWKVEGKKAVYTATAEDNESETVTIYFSMPEGDVSVTADYADPFENGAVDIGDKDVKVYLSGIPEDKAAFYLSDKKVTPQVTVRYKNYTLSDKDFKAKYGRNNSVGEGIVTLLGKSYFKGRRVVKFKIVEENRKAIASVEFVKPDLTKGGKACYYYTGSPITFVDKALDPDSIYAIEVKDADGNTVSANDYVLGYDKNTKVGAAKLFVSAASGSAKYCGSLVKSFKVEKADLSKLIVEGDPTSRMVVNETNRIADVEYVKAGAKPSVQIWYDKTINLRNKKDYKVSYSNNRNVSTDKKKAKVTIKGVGNYKGKVVMTLNIKPFDITDSDMMINVGDILENSSLSPKVVLMRKSSDNKKISKSMYTVSVYETASGNTVSANAPGTEVTGQKADATKNYVVKIEGKKNLTGALIRPLRVADRDHMINAGKLKFGSIFYQAGAIRLDRNGNGTLRVDSSNNSKVSDNSIRVMTTSGKYTLTADQIEIYMYKQKTKENITSAGKAVIYLRVKDGAKAPDGKPFAGDISKTFSVKPLKLISLDKYRKLVSSNKAMGYAAINHESANTLAQVTEKTNLFDVMDEDTTYGKEQYYTGYQKTPGYTGASADSDGLRVLINGNAASMPFIDYKLSYNKNVNAAKISKKNDGITYGGQNKEDPVPYNYVKGSGAEANFTGTVNYKGSVKFMDAFYIRPRTVDDLEIVSVNSIQFNGKALLNDVKYVKFIDPRYGVEDFMKRGTAYNITVKNVKKVSGSLGDNAPYLQFTAKNDLIGSKEKNTLSWSFAVSSRKLTEANTVIKEINPQKYMFGMAVEPSVTVKCEGKTLMKNKDYVLEYANNHDRCSTVDADGFEYESAPTIRIIGIGNYTGELTRTFVIR